MTILKKVGTLFTAGLFAFALVGCSGSSDESTSSEETTSSEDANTSGGLISIVFPDQSEPYWPAMFASLEPALTEAGYTVEVSYASDQATQNSNIEAAIANDPAVMLITAVDGSAATEAVNKAHEAGIKIVAFDRLILDTDAIDGYVTFGLVEVGTAMGQYVEAALDLENASADDPKSIEFFAGAPTDNNAKYFFQGSWDVLQPYFESGVLFSPSGRTTAEFTVDDWKNLGIDDWDTANAQELADGIFSAFYEGKNIVLDAIIAPNTQTADAIAISAENHGFVMGTNFPLIATQDIANQTALDDLKSGKIAFDIWKNPANLAAAAANLIPAVVSGDLSGFETTMNNNIIDVPTHFESVIGVVGDNSSFIGTNGWISVSDAISQGAGPTE